MERAQEMIKEKLDSPAGPLKNPSFFIAVIHQGSYSALQKTIASIHSQKFSPEAISLKIFHRHNNIPEPDLGQSVELIPFQNDADFFGEFVKHINESRAAYYVTLKSGDCFFDHSLDIISETFDEYPEINWLTGIQTIQAEGGFNIMYGSIATRRWNYEIFERNLYKKSARYIPAGSTFWRRGLWDKASPHLYFVLLTNFWEDMWLAFFKVAQLYTSNSYISSTSGYDVEKMRSSSKNIHYLLLEDNFIERIQEFFFINNVPYLRLYYSKKNKLVPVVRYDYEKQACFLNDY